MSLIHQSISLELVEYYFITISLSMHQFFLLAHMVFSLPGVTKNSPNTSIYEKNLVNPGFCCGGSEI
jgi:hypothetical protein